MQAKVIVDNIAGENLSGEWGLCVYITYGDQKILLDTGASRLFASNAEAYGIDLADVDMGVLSHAHYDHAGGLETFFQVNKKASFYLQAGTQENCYSKKLFFHKYIGIPKGVLQQYRDRIVFVTGDYKLCEGVYLIPHKTSGLENVGKREKMYTRTGVRWVPDRFSHEQSLVFETEKGLVIFNSCSHAGASTIIKEVRSTFPDKPVYALIGGLHLFNKSEDEVREFAANIRETGVEYVCTGHCTGKRAYEVLKEELGERMNQFKVGFSMEF